MLSGANALAYPLIFSTTSVTEKRKLYKFGTRLFFLAESELCDSGIQITFSDNLGFNPFLRFSQKILSKKVKTDFFDEKCFFVTSASTQKRRRQHLSMRRWVDPCHVVAVDWPKFNKLIFYLFFEPVSSPGNGTTRF